MSDTPRTDEVTRTYGDASVEWEEELVPVDACRAIERELNAANQRIKQLEDARTAVAANSLANMLAYEDAVAKIKRLEEAGDAMAEWLEDMRNLGADACLSHAWREAKEDKP